MRHPAGANPRPQLPPVELRLVRKTVSSMGGTNVRTRYSFGRARAGSVFVVVVVVVVLVVFDLDFGRLKSLLLSSESESVRSTFSVLVVVVAGRYWSLRPDTGLKMPAIDDTGIVAPTVIFQEEGSRRAR